MNQCVTQDVPQSEFRLPLYYVLAVWGFCWLLTIVPGWMVHRMTDAALAIHISSILGQLIVISALISIFRSHYTSWAVAAGLGRPNTNFKFWGTLLASVVVLRASLILLPPQAEDLQWMEQHSTNAPLLLVFLGTVILAPLAEELFYRQFLWQALQQQWQRPWLTIVITSVTWALVHGQYTLMGLFHIFLFGLILGWSRQKTDSLWIPIGLHGLNNGFAFAVITLGLGS